MKHLFSLLFTAFFIGACADADPPAPPIASCPHGHCNGTGDETESGTASETGSQTMTMSEGVGEGVDETGQTCDPMMVNYACHGYVAGLYKRKSDGFWAFSFSGNTAAICVGEDPYEFFITAPEMGTEDADLRDNEVLLAMCQEKCEADVLPSFSQSDFDALAGNPNPDIWKYNKKVCVVEAANNGAIPPAMVGGQLSVNGFASGCPWVDDTNRQNPLPASSIVYLGPAEEDTCAVDVGCGAWNADLAANVSHSVSGTTHTAQVDATFFDYLMESEGMQRLYQCDDGRYLLPTTGTRRMYNVTSGDLLYKLGLRSGDKGLTIQKSGTGQTVYPLESSVPNMVDAFNALYPLTTNNLVVKWKRPTSGSTFVNHTENLTIVP